jgi:hypothetical protein
LLLFVLDLDCGDTGGTGATSFADAMVKWRRSELERENAIVELWMCEIETSIHGRVRPRLGGLGFWRESYHQSMAEWEWRIQPMAQWEWRMRFGEDEQ